jgi:peptidoglycan biosynthesis protein MviN/MurJ (putative lipid II flippase)
MIASIIGTSIGVVIGAVVAWVVTYVYYRRAGDALRDESEKLRKLTMKVLRGLEEAGLIRLARDPDGNLTGGLLEDGEVDIGGSKH